MENYLLFYDGELTIEVCKKGYAFLQELLRNKTFYYATIDGAYGCAKNMDDLEDLFNMKKKKSLCVISNTPISLNYYGFWSEKKQHHNIYLYKEKEDTFKRIDSCTDKYLRLAHNISKMYIAGEFND